MDFPCEINPFHFVLVLLSQILGPVILNLNFAALFSLALLSHLKTIKHTNAQFTVLIQKIANLKTDPEYCLFPGGQDQMPC